MFVDLVGSTRISSRMDPEEWSDALRDYQAIVAGVVARFDGPIAQYLGDGVLCFFGWPQAMEDAAEQAAETALEIQAAMARFDAGGERLDCRIGIATGLVVVGELIGRSDNTENTAIGQTLNLAALLQSSAKAGQIVISEATRALLGNAFTLEPPANGGSRAYPGRRRCMR